MARKIIFLAIIILILFSGGIFYWWQNQADVRELNKTLPKGVIVTKSLFGLGNEYWVKNKIDGYEFRVPMEWRGLVKIEYLPEVTGGEYTSTALVVSGKEGEGRIVGLDRFRVGNLDNFNLVDWVENIFQSSGSKNNFIKDTLGEFEVIRSGKDNHLLGMSIYFFKKDSVVYSLSSGSEQSIKEIILSGKW